MDSQRPEIDIEKELTCSICTELLYQPLTLLDCLHTFCGACLEEWFSWQATAAKSAPGPPPTAAAADSSVFTCPSCRAPVRDARHNAGVATLLGMFLAANPDKARDPADVAEMDKKYRPGDSVLPRLDRPRPSPEQARLEEEERRLLEEVRLMSLHEVVADGSSSSRREGTSRSRGESSSRDRRRRRRRTGDRRDASRESSRARNGGETARRRQTTEEDTRRRIEQSAALRADSHSAEESGRQRRSGSRQRHGEHSEAARRRHIEHQSSLRSLISSADMGSVDIEREIEEFARQIQEEGLLDGLDLDNLNLDPNDDLSRRITEAYRRRHRLRPRTESARRSNGSGNSRQSDVAVPEARSRSGTSSRPTSRQRTRSASRSQSTNRRREDRSRPPISSDTTHLDVQEPGRRHRRRTTSGARSATTPVSFAPAENRNAARSQTDLSQQPRSADARAGRPVGIGDSRSLSTPIVGESARPRSESSNSRPLPFSARVSNSGLGVVRPSSHDEPVGRSSGNRTGRARWPTDLTVGSTRSTGLDLPEPVTPAGTDLTSPTPRSPSPLYREPSITCNRCRKEHIEYELHYSCSICHAGNWNICLSCYRRGKGCLHWFGFGYAAWSKWERVRGDSDSGLAEPHVLTANRFTVPEDAVAGSADGQQGYTSHNPAERLQSGTFCSRCFAWTNECFWRCGICNDGDWGFCRDCVNQGCCCTHPLLPLAYCPPHSATDQPTSSRNPSPSSPNRSYPAATTVTILPGSDVAGAGAFRPLSYTIRCDACRSPIPPAHHRFHCYFCRSSVDPDSRPGDYELCQGCYAGLVGGNAISPENGPGGWRRCPQGHRMAVLCFLDSSDGQWRSLVRDCVGGQKLQFEQYDGGSNKSNNNGDYNNNNNNISNKSAKTTNGNAKKPPPVGSEAPGLQLWYWYEGDRRLERLVARDVRATAMAADPGVERRLTDRFPPSNGGYGMRALARWGWYPSDAGAEDELLFPRGAEIREIEDVNKEWFHGVFMGAKGLFPAPYVQVLDK